MTVRNGWYYPLHKFIKHIPCVESIKIIKMESYRLWPDDIKIQSTLSHLKSLSIIIHHADNLNDNLFTALAEKTHLKVLKFGIPAHFKFNQETIKSFCKFSSLGRFFVKEMAGKLINMQQFEL